MPLPFSGMSQAVVAALVAAIGVGPLVGMLAGLRRARLRGLVRRGAGLRLLRRLPRLRRLLRRAAWSRRLARSSGTACALPGALDRLLGAHGAGVRFAGLDGLLIGVGVGCHCGFSPR
jgi:hypothetical protein